MPRRRRAPGTRDVAIVTYESYEPPRLETLNGGMSGRALFQSLVGKGGFFRSHSRQHVIRHSTSYTLWLFNIAMENHHF